MGFGQRNMPPLTDREERQLHYDLEQIEEKQRTEREANKKPLAQIEANKKIQARVKATEDAYRDAGSMLQQLSAFYRQYNAEDIWKVPQLLQRFRDDGNDEALNRALKGKYGVSLQDTRAKRPIISASHPDKGVARAATMYDGEYAQLGDQVYDQYLNAPQMQQKLTHLAHALVEKTGQPGLGSVTVTDDVIKMMPKLVQNMTGSSDCDQEKHAYMEALLTQYRNVVKQTRCNGCNCDVTWTVANVKEFLDSLFTGRTLLATSLINTVKDEQERADREAELEAEREAKLEAEREAKRNAPKPLKQPCSWCYDHGEERCPDHGQYYK